MGRVRDCPTRLVLLDYAAAGAAASAAKRMVPMAGPLGSSDEAAKRRRVRASMLRPGFVVLGEVQTFLFFSPLASGPGTSVEGKPAKSRRRTPCSIPVIP